MKFVDEFLQKHHVKQNPHKWMLAACLSPIHTAELHYKKHYHLRFVHARKLFLFDLTLLLTTIAVLIAGIFWWTYDPTVTDLVYLSITPDQERLISGQDITYYISYHNESDVTLTHPTISLDTPPGLSISTYSPNNLIFDELSQTFTMSPIAPHTSGTIQFSGTFFATPHVENTIHATLGYIQKGKERREQKTSPAITVVRDSIIEVEIDIPEQALGNSSLPVSITLKNSGDISVSDISLPLIGPRYTTLIPKSHTRGTITDDIWQIDVLDENQTATLDAILTINTPQNISNILFSLTPAIEIDTEIIDQQTSNTLIQLLHPHIQIDSSWKDPYSQPGTTQYLIVNFKNTTNIPLTNITLDIPATNYSTKQSHTISSLNPEHSQTATIPINTINIGNTQDIDPALILTPQITARVPQIPSATYTTQHTTNELPIGTNVFFNAELRYYTAEGDQLGRGPLPPQIGKETKYWAFLRVSNTTSRIKNTYLTATLPNYVSWTGKTSVSHGQDVQYNTATRQITWSHPGLNPHTTAGIYIELALTPTATMSGTSPTMLQNISLSAHDTYIDIPISRTTRSIDISLPTDPIGGSKGTTVQ